MSSSDGLFVSIDGPSGVGKSTTARALAQLMKSEGRLVHLTREPSDGPIGELARDLAETVYGIALACLYAADRYYHLTAEVFPKLEEGAVVITDRYVPSTLVMQQLDGVNPSRSLIKEIRDLDCGLTTSLRCLLFVPHPGPEQYPGCRRRRGGHRSGWWSPGNGE